MTTTASGPVIASAAEEVIVPHKTMLTRIRAEYLEMRGLRLTLQQAQRLCGVERAPCQMVLDLLVDEKFLCVKSDEQDARLTDGADYPCPQPAKADLNADKRVLAAS